MISVIIPTLNEEKALPHTLSCLLEQASPHEIIIVDGGSNDATLSTAENFRHKFNKITILRAKQGRANQLNAGVEIASGKILLFLHADTQLPNNGLEQIRSAMHDKQLLAGCFRQKFSGNHWGLKLTSCLHNWRFHVTKIMYGDQAMFVRRSIFIELGGFLPQHAEDIHFSEKLLTLGTPRMLNATATTDSRKFQQIGVWRALWQVIVIQCQHRRGQTINHPQFFQNYR